MSVYIRDTKHEHGKATKGFTLDSDGSDDDWETDPDYVNDISEKDQRWGSKATGLMRGAVEDVKDIHALREKAKAQDTVAAEADYVQRGKFSRGYGGDNGVEGADASTTAEPRTAPAAAPAKAAPGPPATKETCTAVYDYEATDDTELSFNEGDVITVLEKIDDGWWSGELNGNVGVFPANYVEQ
ncbi:cortactin isoform F [Thecamonas trahens ATCC 50062]|uniref:Cortactin isoform F n=1 Tax=Thecamonas trahens ATCC 50062 TaxID=461836 RepID=A0A0L0DF28_THETB|nr:cortactin isoform F [Thecamonas trahens ATCC 50062]KNC50947.1 cortactin isoform F [Thecamonas trahens ATCC 50062]|eukprot:XP_013756644.1 cortactin isoform F [Thecamonas trahens ATCC 50062]